MEQGFVTGELKAGFPPRRLPIPTISSACSISVCSLSTARMKEIPNLVIPNQVVREQLYNYLLDTYGENDLQFGNYDMGQLSSRLAYRGDWQAYFGYRRLPAPLLLSARQAEGRSLRTRFSPSP